MVEKSYVIIYVVISKCIHENVLFTGKIKYVMWPDRKKRDQSLNNITLCAIFAVSHSLFIVSLIHY